LNPSDIDGGNRDARDAEAPPDGGVPPPASLTSPNRSTSAEADDERWMAHALELAGRGRFGASPNPMVGAVVLDSDGRLAGKGHHAACGGVHAEIGALTEAGDRARGGTLFVTLEPCSHFGRTPPCVDAIVRAGVRRVVVGLRDPNPEAAGGIEALQSEGIEVTEGVGSESGRILNRRWLRWARTRRPWVSAKAAISLDGRVATRTGHSRWITGEPARNRGLVLREEHDAIAVGVGTVIADDPRLTRRLGLNPGEAWRRVILDSTLRTPSDAIVVQSDPEITLIAHTDRASDADRQRLAAAGVELVELLPDDAGRVSVAALLDVLGQRGVSALLVEGGPHVHGSFFDSDLVDELFFFVAPLVIGGEAPSAVGGLGAADLPSAPRFVFETTEAHNGDLELHAVRPEDADVHGSD
jgi:diaminohydroxyphosphoribosylaminopyrimidine deaminase/5-amino-6-(5-phosphoribosylamino)uracil reductase